MKIDEKNKNSWLNPETEKDTYFVIVNKNERTIKAGEQIFLSYGRRTNSDLLLHYAFCYENNMYQHKELSLNLDPKSLKPSDLQNDQICATSIQQIFLKVNQFNKPLMAYLRRIRAGHFACVEEIEGALEFEKECVEGYVELMAWSVTEEVERETTMGEDLEMLGGREYDYNMHCATIYRIGRK